jgi:hypothetical protein
MMTTNRGTRRRATAQGRSRAAAMRLSANARFGARGDAREQCTISRRSYAPASTAIAH